MNIRQDTNIVLNIFYWVVSYRQTVPRGGGATALCSGAEAASGGSGGREGGAAEADCAVAEDRNQVQAAGACLFVF